MSVQRGLDRKAKAAVAGLFVIVLGISVLGLRSCVVALTPERPVAAPDSSQDEIVLIGKQTMVVPSGSVGSKIVSWLSAGGRESQAFEVGELSFPPGSDEPSEVGLAQFDRFAALMRANVDVKARVIVFEGGEDRSGRQLAQKRARRIRAELLARGIPLSRVSAEAQAAPSQISAGKQPSILVVLSK